MRLLISLALAIFLSVALAHAGSSFKKPEPRSEGSSAGGDSRSKTLEFDDLKVEGMNKRPGDMNSTIKKGRDRSGHLYDKNISFGKDLDETLREMRYTQ
jgi:hypothetical protein